MFTTFITQSTSGVNETYIALSASNSTGSYIVRPHGFGTDWKRLRIGVRFTSEQAMGGTLAAFSYAFNIGVCHNTGSPNSAYVKNAYWCDFVPNGSTYVGVSGGNMAYWPMGGNIVSIKGTYGTTWYSLPSTVNVYYPASFTAATRRLIFVDIISGSPFTFTMFYPSTTTAAPDTTKSDFYDQFQIPSCSFTNHATAYGVGGTINGPTLAGTPMTMSNGQGELDNVFVSLSASPKGPRIFITDWAVWKMF